MLDSQPSRTALATAYLRAAHQLLDAPPRVLEDPLAVSVLGDGAADRIGKDAARYRSAGGAGASRSRRLAHALCRRQARRSGEQGRLPIRAARRRPRHLCIAAAAVGQVAAHRRDRSSRHTALQARDAVAGAHRSACKRHLWGHRLRTRVPARRSRSSWRPARPADILLLARRDHVSHRGVDRSGAAIDGGICRCKRGRADLPGTPGRAAGASRSFPGPACLTGRRRRRTVCKLSCTPQTSKPSCAKPALRPCSSSRRKRRKRCIFRHSPRICRRRHEPGLHTPSDRTVPADTFAI